MTATSSNKHPATGRELPPDPHSHHGESVLDNLSHHATPARPDGRPQPPAGPVVCGVDLHAEFLQVCVLNSAGGELLNRRVAADGQAFLAFIGPFLPAIEVAAEGTTGWYWLADLCEGEGIPFHLFDARRAMAGRGGRKSDRNDARHLADLLMRPNPPEVYACPRHLRGPRDLARGWHAARTDRTRAVNRLKAVFRQYAIVLPKGGLAEAVLERLTLLPDAAARWLAERHLDAALLGDRQLKVYRRDVLRAAGQTHAAAVRLLGTLPGIGPDLSAAIACEVCDVSRFAGAENLVGYAGLATGPNESGGRKYGTKAKREGNGLLRWAFNLAAGQMLRRFAPAQSWAATRAWEPEKKRRATLAARIARTVYAMLKGGRPFDAVRFAASLGRKGQPVHHLQPATHLGGVSPAI